MRGFRFSTILLCAFVFVGCSAVGKMPAKMDMTVKSMKPPEGKALVYIMRPSIVGYAIKMVVTCDDMYIGTTGGKRYIYVVCDPGRHTFTSRAENTSSLDMFLEPGMIYFLEQVTDLGLAKARNKLVNISSIEGREKLTRCSLSSDLGARDVAGSISVDSQEPSVSKKSDEQKKVAVKEKEDVTRKQVSEEVIITGQTETKGVQPDRKFYVKGGLGGGGVEDIPMFLWTDKGGEVKIKTWTGLALDVSLGYEINPKMSVEIGIGRIKNSHSEKIKETETYFKSIPLTTTFIYRVVNTQIQAKKVTSYDVYLGAGVGQYFSNELYRKASWTSGGRTVSVKNVCKYSDTAGFHALIGGRMKIDTFSIFLEIKKPFVTYEIEEMTDYGVKIPDYAIFSDWKELNTSMMFALGAGYHF